MSMHNGMETIKLIYVLCLVEYIKDNIVYVCVRYFESPGITYTYYVL
jgi:hypothetical protein